MALPIEMSKSSPTNDGDQNRDQYVLQIIRCQAKLYAYILSLSLNRETARDILQQTNVVLLEKEAEFQAGTNFDAWACRVAYYEVLSMRRNRARERHLFNDELLSLIAVSAQGVVENLSEREVALRKCLDQLPKDRRDLLQARYESGVSITDLSQRLQKTSGAISTALHRCRVVLMECIDKRLTRAVIQ